jgi:hypothetical protein
MLTETAKQHETRIIRDWKHKLATNQNWAIRGMIRIHEKQTADEKLAQATSEDNGVGFTGLDAPILSSFCDQMAQRGFLTQKQLAIVFKKMPKYARQLWVMAGKP